MTTPMDAALIKTAIDLVTQFFKRQSTASTDDFASQIATSVDRHLHEALKWSQRLQFYGMWRAEDTEAATIPLRLSVEPRQFRDLESQEQKTELDLLRDDRNYVLLGAPGAGKTTTLKRITQTLLLSDSVGDGDSYQFPIVIRLREFDFRTTLLEAIANTLGLPVSRRIDEIEVDYGSPKEKRTTFLVGKSRLEQAIIDLLNESRAVLILDGLDEVPAGSQAAARRDLARLALNTKGSKILVSCRSGEYAAVIEGFDLMEICPLQPSEITAIAALWLTHPEPFLGLLDGLPYHDVADRPLLLTQLLFLYKRYGYLPEQPSQVCRKFVILLLQEWDAGREVIRESRYAKFDPDRKEAFLAAISYYLTYKVRKRVFSERDLIAAYAEVHDRFGLPPGEARQVVSEIESHSGIIASAGAEAYEFEHLSLQEYLCADYLIREPHAEHLVDYMVAYPAPIAISIALSSNPSSSFAALFLRSKNPALNGVHGLLTRVIVERPTFGILPALGVAIMKLYRDVAEHSEEARKLLDQMVQIPAVTDSVAAAVSLYQLPKAGPIVENNYVKLNRARVLNDARGFRTPDSVSLPFDTMKTLAGRGCAYAQSVIAAIPEREHVLGTGSPVHPT